MIELNEIREIPALMQWRREVIRNVFGREPDGKLLEENREYYARHIADGTHLALVATVGGEDAGCGAICLTDELPSPDNPTGRCAYLMNIYVREPFRNRGVAHRIVSRLIDEARMRGCRKIFLETTEEGKPVYTSLG
ncbi:MAG: GNAT family N-acetyltransferase, partial [Duncaniella sp.]|nr:GNAT family N-acetyltransferase [Duncaniella sp.]